MSTKTLNLITGGSGFVASRCILDGLQRGYAVRTTVRSMKRAEGVKKMLLHGGTTQSQVESVEFSTTDLVKDEGWLDACKGCTYILHVASPFPPGKPKHEDNLIVPARDGTLRVLKAAKASGTVKRVVLTSSIASVVERSCQPR